MTVAGELNKLIDTKENIRLAIVGKGQTISTSDKFDTYPSKITAIESGGGGDVIDWELATDDDFSGTSNGLFRYIGSKKFIIMPNVIKGQDMISYMNMFYSPQGNLVEGIISANKNIETTHTMLRDNKSKKMNLLNFDTSGVTNAFAMFRFHKSSTEFDLSGMDFSNCTNFGSMFQTASATVGYARTQADADLLNASAGKPAGLTFIVKP